MKHFLKNTTNETMNIGNVVILPNEFYEFYCDKTKVLGNYFKNFRENFDYNLIINESLIYFIDNTQYTIEEFSIIWNNLPDISHYTDEQNFKLYYYLNEDKIYEPINPTIVPKSIDYKTDIKHLHQKLTFNKGFLVECEYFENMSVSTDEHGIKTYIYDNNILKVIMVYHVNEFASVNHRNVKRYWARLDGTYSPDYKESVKYYTELTSRDEGIVRRNNIINDAITKIGGLMLMTCENITNVNDAETIVFPLLNELDSEINKYLKAYMQPLIDKVSNIDVSLYNNIGLGNWFDNIVPNTNITIRRLLLSKLADGIIEPNEIIS